MFAEFNWHEAISSSPIFLFIVGCSIVMLGIAVERFYYYWKRRGNPDETLEKVLRMIRGGDLKEAAWECENSIHPIGNVAIHALQNGGKEPDNAEERIQIALSQQKMLLERNLGILGTLAAIAPLIGLLGTVWGIMRAFSDMAITGSAAPSVVASGVAEALVTTAAGLIVAVPALMFYNYFSRRMNVILTVAENHARSIRMAVVESESKRAKRQDDVDRHVDWDSLRKAEREERTGTLDPAHIKK